MPRKESSNSPARKLDHKAGREKPRSRTKSSDPIQPLADLSTQKAKESDGKRSSIHSGWIKKHWPTLIAILAMVVSICALISDNIHYAQLTKPHAEFEEACTRLDVLINKTQRFKELVDLESFGYPNRKMDNAINDAEVLISRAQTALIKGDVASAMLAIEQATEGIDDCIPPSTAPIETGEVSVTASPFKGFATVKIDPDTIVTTKEGELISMITILYEEPPPEALEEYVSVLSFEICPDGVILSRPITLEFFYLTDYIPRGVVEKDLVIGAWDEYAGAWTLFPSTVDLGPHTVSASINRLGLFAVIAPRPD